MASAFPPRYTKAMVAGQSLAGLAVALAALSTTLAAGSDDASCMGVRQHQQSSVANGFWSSVGSDSGFVGTSSSEGTIANAYDFFRQDTMFEIVRRQEYEGAGSRAFPPIGSAGRATRGKNVQVEEAAAAAAPAAEVTGFANAFDVHGFSELNSLSSQELPPLLSPASPSTTTATPMTICMPYSADLATLTRYAIAISVLLACMATYPSLERHPLATFYMARHDTNASRAGGSSLVDAKNAENLGSNVQGANGDVGRVGYGAVGSRDAGRGSCNCDGCKAGSWEACSGTASIGSESVSDIGSSARTSSLHVRLTVEAHQLLEEQAPTEEINSSDLRQPLLPSTSSSNPKSDDGRGGGDEGGKLRVAEEGWGDSLPGERKLRDSSTSSCTVLVVSECRSDGGVSLPPLRSWVARRRVFWRNKLAPISRYGFSVFFCFVVSISMYPAATSEIISRRRCSPGSSRFFSDDIFTLFSFVSYNAFDLLGRLAVSGGTGGVGNSDGIVAKIVVIPESWLPLAALSRLALAPLLLACRTTRSSQNLLMGPWGWLRSWMSSSDIFPLTVIPLFGFTNGFLVSLSMMGGSQRGAWAGAAMVVCLSFGLLVGSLMSFVVLLAN